MEAPPVPPPPPAVAVPTKKKNTWALWLGVGCGCLLVPVVGVVVAIALPAYVSAMHRGKQHSTVSDLETISTAVRVYGTDHDEPCPAAATLDELARELEPTYINQLPRQDGWGHQLRYQFWSDEGASERCLHFAVSSAGRDGVFEHEDARDYETRKLTGSEVERDLVGSDAFVVQGP